MFALPSLALLGSAVGVDPEGYVCEEQTDIAGSSCDIGRYGNCHDGTCVLSELAKTCDGLHAEKECNGFNSNGYMKRCVRESCGAEIKGSHVVSCTRVDVPQTQPTPSGCTAPPSPSPTPSPAPSPSPTPAPTPLSTCSGKSPPFALPAKPVPELDDWHNPSEELEEANALSAPAVASVDEGSATLRDPKTGSTATVTVGSNFQNWMVAAIMHQQKVVVLEQGFERWSTLAFMAQGQEEPHAMLRRPVGRLEAMSQPLYRLNETDPDWYCKQDNDTEDWLGKIASQMSDGEPTFNAASSVFAPNNDNGIFGNPEELNKWVLTSKGDVKSQDFPRDGRSGGYNHLSLHDHLPTSCHGPAHGYWANQKGGLVGRHLRVVEQGFWDPDSSCGASMMAVSPPATSKDAVSVALLRITTLEGENVTTAYLRVRANQTTSEPLGIDDLGSKSDDFYAAILSQVERWDKFVAFGADPSIPSGDRRYRDMPNALMTGFLNTFRGMTPEYGMGKFANEYNEFLPLDTLALHEGLLEWGHHDISRPYLSHFFGDNLYVNGSSGEIIYSMFGCDGDADYGRLISLYVKAARYSGDQKWAASLLPVIERMAGVVLRFQEESMASQDPSSLLYGLAAGSPEHDLCGSKSYFFNVNVWMVRGLSDLAAFLQETALSHDSALEARLAPAAQDWRMRLQAAAEFTAVRRSDGSVFFLHPCVGSDCGKVPVLKPGGSESSCIENQTCWEYVAQWPGTKQNQIPNYANFRLFSETLLAGALDAEYEEAIIDFRDTHRGTITGMTRFRDVLDDMPILGYGWGLLSHDRLEQFHTLLAGHSANYLSRGTYWSSEQRQQQQPGGVLNERWTNNCGDGGEDCSLCMVSAMPPTMWIRWMLVQESRDLAYVHLARGAPKRWYTQPEPFGLANAPTRFGVVSYSLALAGDTVQGTVSVSPHPFSTHVDGVRYTVRLISPHWEDGATLDRVKITAGAAELVTIYRDNSTAVFAVPQPMTFNFTASFAAQQAVTFV